MKRLRQIFSAGCLGLFLPFLAIIGVSPALSNNTDYATRIPQADTLFQATITPTVSTETSSTFEISLAELGYEEKVLNSPYGSAEYTLRLPEGWKLREGSSFDLDLSYAYSSLSWIAPAGPASATAGQGTATAGPQAPPSFLGNMIVAVDGQTQLVFPIKEPLLEHFRLSVALPLSLLNVSARNVHSIQVTLDASLICDVPHKARLIVHPTSFFSLAYDRLPVTIGLDRYPRPFYRQAFESDQVRFVLPASPTESELTGATAVAAKLGDLTYSMVISGTTDLDLISRIAAAETPQEHLIVIGKPGSNRIVAELSQLGVLPIPLRERQLSLASQGPATVVPGGDLTYMLMLTNTTQETFSSLSLVDTLPDYAQVVTCSPSCAQTVAGEVSWSVVSLRAREALSYTLRLHLSQVITADSFLENTVTLLDAASKPINVNTLTATISSTPQPAPGRSSSVSTGEGYFFLQGEYAVPEGDGIVQEIVSPWDQTRAILIISGLSDEAVYKASRAMGSENHFPGMEGSFALVRETHLLPEPSAEPPSTDLTFADLGYDDKTLAGFSQEADYYFDIPVSWRLTEAAYLDLHFSHSQLFNYDGSSLSVLLNNKPIASVALSDKTSLNGEIKVPLPPFQVRPGRGNRISIRTEMLPPDRCVNVDMWLLINSTSLLHLDHQEQGVLALKLDLYPYPFDQQPGLSDVLFLLPPGPRAEEWEGALQLAAALGSAAGGSGFAPAVALGDTWPDAKLSNYHLVAIGRPSRNPVLRRVNAQLPQPFLPDSDAIEQKLNGVILRLPPKTSLGYVQLLASPWNETRAFLAVTGTTDEGVQWAMDTLAHRSWVLKGNLVLIKGDQVNTIDTRGLTRSGVAMAVATAVPGMTPVPMTTATTMVTPTSPLSSPTPGASTAGQIPAGTTPLVWLIPLVGITALIVIAIFVIAFWQARR